MTLRSPSLFIISCLVCVGLFVAGCDSGGGNGNEPPKANFDVSVNEYTADFTNTSSDPDGEIVSSEWEFGDGNTSSDKSPAHTYEANDTYEVTLTVTDDQEATDSTTMDVSTALTTFEIAIENVSPPAPILKSGVFAAGNEVGTSDGSNPLTPGEAYEFSFTAAPNEIPGTGMQFSLASMFVQSNDIFYAFKPGGISLFNDDGTPISGNVTDSLAMWDAGTEQDQTPGEGGNQAPRQDTLNQGPDDSNNLVLVDNSDGGGQPMDDGFEYPQVSESIQVTIQSEQASTGGYQFTVRIENVGGATQVNGAPMVISPGTYAVHWDNLPNGDDLTYPQFVPGEDATGTGIERIAEDGRPAGALDSDPNMPPGNHAGVLASLTGVTVPLSPGGYAAHNSNIRLFSVDSSASEGVERIAEDGSPATLVSSLQGDDRITDGGAFSVPDGASEPGPLAPTPPDADNNSYTVTVDAAQGDRLSIGTMYIQSNDVFYAFQPEGLPLFTDDGSPISGDQTGKLRLYDAGTEVDEEPGVGLDQAPRQSDTNTGEDENGSIVRIQDSNGDGFPDNDGFSYAPILDANGNPTIIKVTVTPQ
ncbi:MAG: spondin domain-containing protein [Salinibacter sp.]